MNQTNQKEPCYEEMKPYEKFMAKGPEYLSEEELLAIIIRTGTRTMDACSWQSRCLPSARAGKRAARPAASVRRGLCKVNGIGRVKAVKIKCLIELSRRLAMADTRERLQFTKPETVADYYMERLRGKETEEVILVMTDNKNRLICDRTLSKGTVNCSLVSPREIFLMAMEYHAVHILLIHNHPSGDASPSRQDIEITKHLAQLCGMMQLPLTDHIIVGDNCYVSFRESGLLK